MGNLYYTIFHIFEYYHIIRLSLLVIVVTASPNYRLCL